MNNRAPFFVTLVFLLFSWSGSSHADPAQSYEQMRTTTIAAFNVYLEGRDKAISALNRNELSEPSYYELRISLLRRIDRRSIDPGLTKYFDEVISEFTETLPYIQRYWDEATNIDRALNTTENMLDNMAESDLEYLFGQALTSGMQESAKEQFQAKWKSVFENLHDKHSPTKKQLLRALSEKYDYSFYDVIFGD